MSEENQAVMWKYSRHMQQSEKDKIRKSSSRLFFSPSSLPDTLSSPARLSGGQLAPGWCLHHTSPSHYANTWILLYTRHCIMKVSAAQHLSWWTHRLWERLTFKPIIKIKSMNYDRNTHWVSWKRNKDLTKLGRRLDKNGQGGFVQVAPKLSLKR